jgi:hypothetical protein
MSPRTYRKQPRRRRWVSTPRRLLTSVGVELPPGFDPALDTPVWGGANIGRVINQSEQATWRLLYAGLIDASQISTIDEVAA